MNASVSISPSARTSTGPAAEQDRLGSIALDQWRGLALVLVLVSHGCFFTDRVNGIGRVGVNLFFFISGLLVFRSLSRSRAASDWERSKSFWWRRFRRLYPALISYLLAMLAVTWWLQRLPGLPPWSDFGSYLHALPSALGCAVNYRTELPVSVGHLWSLACEMQFYLVGPLIFWAGGATRQNVVFAVVLVVLTGLGVLEPMITHWRSALGWKYHFEFAAWPMMAGFCCEWRRDFFRRVAGGVVTAALWGSICVCLTCGAVMIMFPEAKYLVIAGGTLLLCPCFLAYVFGRPMPGMGGRAMKWCGERTYSIYLWQQPLTICGFLPNALHPVGAAVSVAVGGVWFHWFERPFLSASRRK